MTIDTNATVELNRPASGGQALQETWPTDKLFATLDARDIINGVAGTSAPGDTTAIWADTNTAPATWKYHNGAAWVTTAGTNAVSKHIVNRAGGGWLTSVSVLSPITGNGTAGSPLDVDEATLVNSLMSTYDGRYVRSAAGVYSDAATIDTDDKFYMLDGATGTLRMVPKALMSSTFAGGGGGLTVSDLTGSGVGSLWFFNDQNGNFNVPPRGLVVAVASGTLAYLSSAYGFGLTNGQQYTALGGGAVGATPFIRTA